MLIKRWGKALFAQKPHQTDPNSNNGAAPTAKFSLSARHISSYTAVFSYAAVCMGHLW
jgi:hypothetical protein